MTLADQVTALAGMTTAELAAEYERLVGRQPRYRSVPWLRKRIAHALQVAAFGGLSRAARAKIDELAADITLPGARAQRDLQPGTIIEREYRGRRIIVDVTDNGFVWNDTRYGSLSAIAFAVTGSKWNGRLFFKLTGRKAKP